MSERKSIRKIFWAWEFEKEEQWLNEMAQSGWLLDGVGFCRYEFIPCEGGAYTVRLEMRDNDPAYLDLMAETGAEYVGRMVQWIYFRKPVEKGPFDIFSDIDSRIGHLQKIARALACIGGANLLIGLAVSSWVNLLCAALLAYGLGRFHGKIEALQKERAIRE